MILLDIRTLSAITVVFCFIYGTGLLVYSNKQSHFRGLSLYGIGNLLAAVSFFLISLREFISDFLSIVIANTLIELSLFCMLSGLTKFIGIKSRLVNLSLIISGLLFLILIYFTYQKPDINIRIIVISLCLALQCLFIVILLEKHKDQEVSMFYSAMSASFLLPSGFLIIRALVSLNMEPINSFMQAGFIHGLTFLFFIYLIVSSNLMLILITGKKLELELEKQALTDPLTGLFNRRALNLRLEEEISKSKRINQPLGVVMADIDRFKLINDKYGHECGDIVLKNVAGIISDTVRTEDIVARIGGEEFVILLSGLGAARTVEIAERIRKNIENQDTDCSGYAVHITTSFGVTVFQGETDENINTILSRADKALYISKKSGRNRTSTLSRQQEHIDTLPKSGCLTVS